MQDKSLVLYGGFNVTSVDYGLLDTWLSQDQGQTWSQKLTSGSEAVVQSRVRKTICVDRVIDRIYVFPEAEGSQLIGFSVDWGVGPRSVQFRQYL